MITPGLLASWEAAYRAAEYRIELPQGDLILRIDQHLPEQDLRLRHEAGVQTHWAILTPCNPGSDKLSPEENAILLEQLHQIFEGLGLPTISTRNRDVSGIWPDEPGILLCDPPPGFAEELGKHFRQNAIVTAKLGEAPQLTWLTF